MKIIYYYHIPKCGGTTTRNLLYQIAKDQEGEFYDFTSLKSIFSSSIGQKINNLKLEYFFKNINKKTSKYKFIHHHHRFYGLGEMQKFFQRAKQEAKSVGNEFHLFTIIRDPLRFQISRTNYLRNSCGQPNLSFEDVINNSKHQNVMYKYFLYNHFARWKKGMNLDKKFFVKSLGIVDKFFLMEEFNDVYDWLEGVAEISNVEEKVNKTNIGKHKILPSEEQMELLRQTNSLDYFFYDTVRKHHEDN